MLYIPSIVLPTSQQNLVTPPNLEYLEAIPNPAKEMTIIHYRFKEGAENPTLLITNINGQKIREFEVETLTGQIEWQPKAGENGVFIISMLDNQKIIRTYKLIISAR